MRKCENCGANLDSGERCDCEKEWEEEQNGTGEDAAGDDTAGRRRAYKRCRGGEKPLIMCAVWRIWHRRVRRASRNSLISRLYKNKED